MKKYFESILLYTCYIFSSLGIAFVVGPIWGLFLLLPFFEGKTGILVEIVELIYAILYKTIFPLTIVYIAMCKVGYKRNTTYEGNPVKELLLPIIISNLLFTIVNISLDFKLSTSIRGVIFFFIIDDNEVNGLGEFVGQYLLENYYSLYVTAEILQFILFVLVMILGVYRGYKKRGKDRKEFIASRKEFIDVRRK